MRKLSRIPNGFSPRPAILKAHHKNRLVLERFALPDEYFATTKLATSNGNQFETVESAAREELYRIGSLLTVRDLKTAYELQLGQKNDEFAASFASAIFSRNFRMRVAKRFMEIAKRFAPETLRRLNMVSMRWRTKPHGLDITYLVAIKRRARRVLDDAGLTRLPGIAIGQIDLSFDGKYYWAHFHLIIAGDKYKAIPALRKIMQRHGGQGLKDPLVVEKITTLGGGLTYCLKSFSKKRRTRSPIAQNARELGLGTRTSKQQEVKWLKVMHQAQVSDVLLLQGLRLGQRGLAPLKYRGRT